MSWFYGGSKPSETSNKVEEPYINIPYIEKVKNLGRLDEFREF